MKNPCNNCGSTQWIDWHMSIDNKIKKEYCSECKPQTILSTSAPNLGAGAINKNKRITPTQYKEAIDKANRTGKEVYL